MRELNMNEILSVNGGAAAQTPLTFEQFAARSSVPAQYMQSAYNSYFSAYPWQWKIDEWAKAAASRAVARATFNDYGPGANRP